MVAKRIFVIINLYSTEARTAERLPKAKFPIKSFGATHRKVLSNNSKLG
jgi:hypothetical protein